MVMLCMISLKQVLILDDCSHEECRERNLAPGFMSSVTTSDLCHMNGALYLRGARLSLAVHPPLLC